MSRPVVGVSCYVEDVDRMPWRGQRSVVLPADYVRHLGAAGAQAVVLPPPVGAQGDLVADVESVAAATVAMLDALVLAGGADIESSRYGEPPDATAQDPRPDRDGWEIALARAAVAADLPLLGICRGMQIMAVAAGGRLIQHLPDLVGTVEHSPELGVFHCHDVRVVEDTALAGILGAQTLSVPTYHHQAVEPGSLSGSTYRASAWHTDGTLEAMEDPTGRFRLAVQWHPEAGADPRLFDALTRSAAS